jgi:beta-aspartyl-peptidase (threonine type)
MRIILANGEGWVGMPKAVEAMKRDRSALDVVEAGIRAVEADPAVHSVGTGGLPNMLGAVELDAAVMEGTTLRAGAVGGLSGYRHPVSVARKVMEMLPHVLLVGEGAARFAAECGQEAAGNLTAESREAWEKWFREKVPEKYHRGWPNVSLASLSGELAASAASHDTVVYLTMDGRSRIAAGASTSGLAWKYPGRLGDSPLIGAGCYADDRYGAAACIGQGELAIRVAAARSVVLYMKLGMDVEAACEEASRDVRDLQERLPGPLTIFAFGRAGEHTVVPLGDGSLDTYCIWTEEGGAPEKRSAAASGTL